jgi:PAS domain S-box-containing protein
VQSSVGAQRLAGRLVTVDRTLLLVAGLCVALSILIVVGRLSGLYGPGTPAEGGPPTPPGNAIFLLLFAAAIILNRPQAKLPWLPAGWLTASARWVPIAIVAIGLFYFFSPAFHLETTEWFVGGTAILFVIPAAAMAVRRKHPWIALAIVLGLTSFFFVALLWSLFDVGAGTGVGFAGGVEVIIILFLGMNAAVLLLEPSRPPVSVLIDDSPAGAAARRMLPVVVLGPPIIGLARLRGETAGLYDSTLGVALYTAAIIGLFCLVLVATTRGVRKVEEQRKLAEGQAARGQDVLALAQSIGHVGSWDWDLGKDEAEWSDELFRIFGLEPSPSGGNMAKAIALVHPDDRARVAEALQAAVEGKATYEAEYRVVQPNGAVRHLAARGHVFRDGQGRAARMVGAVQDVTEARLREEEVFRSRERMTDAQRIAQMGSWEWDVVNDKATWSPELFRIFGLDASGSAANYARAITMIHPEDADRFAADVKKAVEGPAPYYSEYRINRSDGQVRYLVSRGEVTRSEAGKATRLVGAVQDITDRKKAELVIQKSREELAEKAAELARSNSELEQFAYVASHDLQEPLRMVASYVQLIERRYKGQLDADADEFIQYAVEGSNRMQSLIQDLLLYSRVGSRGKDFVATDVGEALQVAKQNLEIAIEESGAQVTNDRLPLARADPAQLGQLFQNLIANAIKFRGDKPPEVHVSGQANGKWCEIVVKDNGIGIDPQYFDRIFLIFQRLHSRADYPGTGIGLAVCKRIVERHGGKIWVESRPGEGAAFHFTVPSAEGG